MKKLLVILLALGLVANVAGLSSAKPKKAKGPLVVGTDETGDWGRNNPSGEDISQVGHESGMDIIQATVGVGEPGILNFVIAVTKLPQNGGGPEVPRYIWGIDVDGEYVELDGKWTNYSRGACDPTSGSCPPPRDPGQQPFIVRANCVTDTTANLSTCEEVGIVKGIFNVADGTITIPVPMELINAKPGSKIGPGSSAFLADAGGNVLTIPAAFVSRADMPSDAMFVLKTYTVPKK